MIAVVIEIRLAEQTRRGVSIATPVFDGAVEADINDHAENRQGSMKLGSVDAL